MYQIVLCTCPDIVCAKTIAAELINDKIAACVNIIPAVTSIYKWQGKIECTEEVQMLIKSQQPFFEQVNRKINQLHPYETPEMIALNIQQGDKHYINWIADSMK